MLEGIPHQLISHTLVQLLLPNDKNADKFNGKQCVYVMYDVRASPSPFFFSSKGRFQINFIYTNNFRHFEMHVSSRRAKINVDGDSIQLCVCTFKITYPFDHEKCIRSIFLVFLIVFIFAFIFMGLVPSDRQNS